MKFFVYSKTIFVIIAPNKFEIHGFFCGKTIVSLCGLRPLIGKVL